MAPTMLELGVLAATLLLFAAPLATRFGTAVRLVSVCLAGLIAVFLLAAFANWTADPHGYDRLLALLLLWPFLVGVAARSVLFLLERAGRSEPPLGGRRQFMLIALLGLPIAIGPIMFLIFG
ncbi:hypothetical protein [Mesorhizobium sp. CAU 1732]|uniref:hypothetical protein n=1 Tax=Mesorhizobium sp. CAU 1732 TaxID=3140358 RepID=UPI00326048BF